MSCENKRFLDMLEPTPACPLDLRQVAVYSYRAYKEQYGRIPTAKETAAGTGLDQHTVLDIEAWLLDRGLLGQGRVVRQPPEGWFLKRDNDCQEHWRHGYAYWRMYVRQPTPQMPDGKKPFSWTEIAVYSFFLHCQRTKYAPKRWSGRYLAQILRLDRETVSHALKRLDADRLVHVTPDNCIVNLTSDLDGLCCCLADREEKTRMPV